jgi:transcriptional regulator with XRE-family HTH domain
MNKKKDFDLGQRLHQLRTERKLSQEQLALRSNITPTYLGLIERNIKNPTVKVVEQLCFAMNISLADFFSNAQLNNENIDEYSLQLIAQVNNCTDEEKR